MSDTSTPPAVLVVDDEELVRTVSRLMLERLGYAVVAAGSGVEAVECLRRRTGPPIAVALIDLTMPGLSGIETMHALRAVDPGLPVVLTSGFGELDGFGTSGPDGPSGFLQKPFQIPALRDALAAVARS